MSKLRLKKRSENTIVHETSLVTVEKPSGRDDFKPIQLPSAESRRQLYKLLLGDEPVTYTPLPPSKLLLQTETAEKSSKPSLSTSKEEEEEERDGDIIQCFPPSKSINAILSQMPPRGRLMSAEELFAPSSDEEDRDGGEEEEMGGGKEEERFFEEVLVLPGSSTEGATKSNSTMIEPEMNSNSTCYLRNSSPHREPENIKVGYAPPHASLMQSKLSHFASSTQTKHTAPSKYTESRKAPLVSKNPLEDSILVDLTEPTHHQRPSASRENHHSSIDHLLPSSSSDHHSTISHQTHNAADPYDLHDEDDFDILCNDIDFSTIDVFSDSESEVVGNGEPKKGETMKSSSVNKGKGRAGPGHYDNLDLSTIDNFSDSEPESVYSRRTPLRKGQNDVTSSKGKGRAVANSYNDQLVEDKWSGIKRPNDFGDSGSRDGLKKRPRLDVGDGEQSMMCDPSRNRSDRHTRPSSNATTAHAQWNERGSLSTQRALVGGNIRERKNEPTNSRTITIQDQQNQRRGSDGIPSSVHESIADNRHTSHSSISASDRGLLQIRHNTKEQRRDRNKPVTHEGRRPSCYTTPIQTSAPLQIDSGPTPPTPTPSSSSTGLSSTSGGGRRTRITPLGSQLTTDTCPMCNTHFPSWYEQVDADRHIAQCLQKVLDLERDNDLVLL